MDLLVKWQGFEVILRVPVSKSILHVASRKMLQLASQWKAVSVATRARDLIRAEV